MSKWQTSIKDSIALEMGLALNKSKKYRLTDEQAKQLKQIRVKEDVVNSNETKSKSNTYKKKDVLSAYNDEGKLMNIDEYCVHYNLPKQHIKDYKLVTHTGIPFYNIVFKDQEDVKEFDFDLILAKYDNFKPCENSFKVDTDIVKNFDVLTYTDVHIGMETNSKGNSMYAEKWDKETILQSMCKMVSKVLEKKTSDTLIIDELGDFLDGFNGYTTRGGHKLPQNMTNEEAFDLALEFKISIIKSLRKKYKEIRVNNICNDNHAGSFGYFVNSAFKNFCDNQYNNVEVVNHRQFINHYFINDICFIISHGKDEDTLKFGFKVQLDSNGLEKIDQYCKQNDIYKKAKKIVFKKGDSHQSLFDLCTSDDFYYFNYPALSPSSQWVQNNFKKGRRGFVLETWKNTEVSFTPVFLTIS